MNYSGRGDDLDPPPPFPTDGFKLVDSAARWDDKRRMAAMDYSSDEDVEAQRIEDESLKARILRILAALMKSNYTYLAVFILFLLLLVVFIVTDLMRAAGPSTPSAHSVIDRVENDHNLALGEVFKSAPKALGPVVVSNTWGLIILISTLAVVIISGLVIALIILYRQNQHLTYMTQLEYELGATDVPFLEPPPTLKSRALMIPKRALFATIGVLTVLVIILFGVLLSGVGGRKSAAGSQMLFLEGKQCADADIFGQLGLVLAYEYVRPKNSNRSPLMPSMTQFPSGIEPNTIRDMLRGGTNIQDMVILYNGHVVPEEDMGKALFGGIVDVVEADLPIKVLNNSGNPTVMPFAQVYRLYTTNQLFTDPDCTEPLRLKPFFTLRGLLSRDRPLYVSNRPDDNLEEDIEVKEQVDISDANDKVQQTVDIL